MIYRVLVCIWKIPTAAVKHLKLYVLQKDKNGKYKEITGDTVYFDAKHPICILLKKTDGYRNFQVYSETKDDDVTYVYNKEKGLYYKKSVKN